VFSINLRVDGEEYTVKFPWKVSIVAFMANPPVMNGDPQASREAFDVLAHDPFFDMIEVNVLPDEAWRLVEPIVRETGIEVASGLQPLVLAKGFNPSALDEDERRKAVEAIKREIEISAARGIRKAAFCSGPDPGDADREAAKDQLVKSLKEIAGFAEKLGVYVILETFDRYWDKRQLIGPITEAVEIAREVRGEHENFGLLWDLSHGPMLSERPRDIAVARDYLAHIHIGCTKKLPDGTLKDWHPGFYRPGAINGVEDVKELLAVLRDIGYRGAVGFEVKPEEGQVWQEPVHAAKGVLYTAFAKLVEERMR